RYCAQGFSECQEMPQLVLGKHDDRPVPGIEGIGYETDEDEWAPAQQGRYQILAKTSDDNERAAHTRQQSGRAWKWRALRNGYKPQDKHRRPRDAKSRGQPGPSRIQRWRERKKASHSQFPKTPREKEIRRTRSKPSPHDVCRKRCRRKERNDRCPSLRPKVA